MCDIFLTLSNGAKLPALGYGTWQAKDDVLEAAVDEALKVGYRHIDTAQGYENEHVVGKVLKKWLDSGKLKRKDIFITTKLSPFAMNPDTVEENCKESLKKLQVDYIDLYLIHFPVSLVRTDDDFYGDPDVHYVDVWKKMEEQLDAGRAKAIGISNFNASQVDHILKNCRIKPATNQIEMHLYLQQQDIVDICHKNGVAVVAYSSLGSSGSTAMGVKTDLNPLNNTVVAEIAKKHCKTPAQILLRHMLQLGVSTIPKSVTPARIKENFKIFDFKLNEKEMEKLKKLDKGPKGRLFDPAFWGKVVKHPEYPHTYE